MCLPKFFNFLITHQMHDKDCMHLLYCAVYSVEKKIAS